MINLKINNIPVSVEPGTTILEAARKLGINIPTLCYLKDINEIGACRICTVEVKNAKGLLPACVYPVNEGMEVFTNTKKVLDARKKKPRTAPLGPPQGMSLLPQKRQLRIPEALQ